MSALEDTFATFISRQTGASDATVVSFDKLSGGAIQDNFGLTLDLEGTQMRATLRGQPQFTAGEDVTLRVDEGRAHFFDGAGQALA